MLYVNRLAGTISSGMSSKLCVINMASHREEKPDEKQGS